jgi:hypothetical protein
VTGASLAGGRKYFTGAATVGYRTHENSGFLSRTRTEGKSYCHTLKNNRVIADLGSKFGLPFVREDLVLVEEFSTISSNRSKCILLYLKILILADYSAARKLRGFFALVRDYLFRG